MNLKAKALKVGNFADNNFVDARGCIYTFLDKATNKPPTDDFFADAGGRQNIMDFSVPGFSRQDVAMYENCGMTTGAYLMSLVFRYQIEKNSDALEKAKRCFKALKHIFELGKKLETGFFPKIYGGRFSEETSSDQCLYAICSMNSFYEFASAEEKKEIDFMIPAIADFWRKRKYIYNYWNQKNMQWPVFRFPIFMLMAYKHSGDKRFKDEYDHLLSNWEQNYPVQFNLLGNKRKGLIEPDEHEKKIHAWIVSSMPDYMTMRMMELEYLLNNDSHNPLAPRWKQSILDMWEQAKLVLTPDGKAYHMVLVDMDTGETRRPEPCELRTSKSGWSTMIARATVQALGFYPDNLDMRKAVNNILNILDISDMTYYDEPERFPAKERFKTRFLSGDSITNWLWAYWQGAAQKLW
jgi:hypothetical protein